MSFIKGTRITAAAVRHNGKVYEGLRHAIIMGQIWDEFGDVKILQDDQGFLTDAGEFLNRWQAGALAFETGQTEHRYEDLMSEHLW